MNTCSMIRGTGELCNSSAAGSTIPVDDLETQSKSVTQKYSEGEILLRRKLATLYRIMDHLGWTQGIYNHITVRVSPGSDEFLINPFGFHYNEITAGSLVKVDGDGAILDEGCTQLGISKAGYTLHSAVHAGRPDVQCVIHVHTDVGAAVSAMKRGLLPISQEAMIVGEVSYHDYNGIFVDEAERQKIIDDLGPKNMVMILRNHGLVAMGRTIEEALHYIYNVVKACQVQVHLQQLGPDMTDELTVPSKAVQEDVVRVVTKGGGGVSSGSWGIGELEFEALVRELHRKGCATGLQLKSEQLIRR